MDSAPTPPPARTALVTGASRGIGRSLAAGLAKAGLDVGLVARDATKLDETAAQVRDLGRTATAATADVTDPEGVANAVQQVEAQLGSIDLLINNAGRIDNEVPLWEADPADWWDTVETNVRGPFLFAHAVTPGMLARDGGRIINLNSGSGTRDGPVATAYSTSKAALFRIGGAIHEAGYDQGLRTFEVAPGVVVTDMTQSMKAHRNRTEWNDVADVLELVVAIARGDLDAFSGRYVRAGTDTLDALLARKNRHGTGDVDDDARRLRLNPWSE